MDLDELKQRRQRIAEWKPDSHEGQQSKTAHMREIDAQISREEDIDDQLYRRRNAEMTALQARERELLDEITRYDWEPCRGVARLGPSGATLHELTTVREEIRRLDMALRLLAAPIDLGRIRAALASAPAVKLEPHK